MNMHIIKNIIILLYTNVCMYSRILFVPICDMDANRMEVWGGVRKKERNPQSVVLGY